MKKIRKYLHQKDKETLARKLATYSAAVTGAMVAAIPDAYAGVVFTSQPTATVSQHGWTNKEGLQASFDLNADGIVDIQFYIYSGTEVVDGTTTVYFGSVTALVPQGNALAANIFTLSGQSSPTPYALPAGDTIGAGKQKFVASPYGSTMTNQQTMGTVPALMNSSGSVTPIGNNVGNWLSATSKFLGVQFEDANGNNHYGWLKMTTVVEDSLASVTFLDGYAYQTVINKPIIAGDTVGLAVPWPADTVTDILGHDVANYDNGSDLEVTFNAATDQSTIGSYRIIVVRDADAATFNLDSANAVPAANYTSIAPDSAATNYAQTLAASATDAEGLPIQNNVPYVIFVLDVADGVNATYNSLSGPSPVITLVTETAADTATNVIASQCDINDNGSALHVSFTDAPDTKTIGSYRVIAVEESDVATFDLTDANNVLTSNYTQVPNTSDSVTFSATANDAEGNPIHDSVTYQVFVLDVADGVNASINSLSDPSAPIILSPQGGAGITSVQELQGVDMYSYSNSIYLHFQNAGMTNGILQVYNTLGQVIYSAEVNGDQKINLNTTEGVYVVSLTQDNKAMRKLLYISNE